MNGNNGFNFGYSFGISKSENDKTVDGEGNNTQSSEDYTIDLSKITPPTFKFGEFGQFGSGIVNSGSGENNEDVVNEITANSINSVDNDSFLAEPSISIGQFDASFSLPSNNDFISAISANSYSTDSFSKSPSESSSSIKSSHSSIPSAPVLIEEPAEQPVYLEEPAPHSVEELLKATIDGDTSDVLMESWENIGIDEIKEAEAEYSKKKAEQEIEEKAVENVEVKAKKRPQKKTEIVETPDVPVLASGKRQRKTVERLSQSTSEPSKTLNDKSISIPQGTGVKLGEIEVLNQNLNKTLVADKILTMLHKIIFDRIGDIRTRKSNIRSYCGGLESNILESKLLKYSKSELSELAKFLGLSGGATKSVLAGKISNFLIKPTVEACKVVSEKKAKSKPASVVVVASKPASKSLKRAAPPAKPAKKSKQTKSEKVLTPEMIDSDVESEVEREVLNELKKQKN